MSRGKPMAMDGSVLHADIDRTGQPLLVALGQQGGDGAQARVALGTIKATRVRRLPARWYAPEAAGGAQAGNVGLGVLLQRERQGCQVTLGRVAQRVALRLA